MKQAIVTFQLARGFTKSLVGALMAAAALMQIPQVNAVVTAVLSAHPRIAPAVSCLIGIGCLLHNPVVQQTLGIQQSSSTELPDGTTVDKKSSVTITQPVSGK